jgi:hypothetical protein
MDMYPVSSIEVGYQAVIAGRPAPTGIGYGCNIEIGCQAAIAFDLAFDFLAPS